MRLRSLLGVFVALAAAFVFLGAPSLSQPTPNFPTVTCGSLNPSPNHPTANCVLTSGPKMGAFYRCCDTPPFGNASAFTPAPATPNPYPTQNGTTISNTMQYCNALDSAGRSIVSGYPLDPTKLNNILDLNVAWVRQDDNPFFIDDTHFGQGYHWGQLDATLCALAVHDIEPAINVDMNSVQYNDANSGGFNPVQHQRYDTPTDFAGWCSALATHVHANFPTDHLYSIPGNELNSDFANVIAGAPPPPVPIATAAPVGTLSNVTAYNYEVTAIVNGVETLPSNPYYSTVTPTNGTFNVKWGPQAGETGGYRVYREAAGGAYGLIASTAHGVTTYQDTGATAGAAPPSTSTVNTTAFENNVASYAIPCYSAIKAADPAAVIYGFEANMDSGLTPVATQFITDERTNFACGPGTCYDGLSIHLSLTYPFVPANPGSCYNGSAFAISCVDAVETAAGRTVPIMFGEFLVTFPGMVPDEPTKDQSIYAQLQYFLTDPRIQYINYANVDECASFPSGFFMNGCVINTSNVRLPSWNALRPFYGAQTQVALGVGNVPKNIPTPSVAAGIVQLVTDTGNPTATLGTAPLNGHVLVGAQIGSNGTMTDSNGHSYSLRATQGDGVGGFVMLNDDVVAGSPTGTLSFSTGVSQESVVYDLLGVTDPGTYQSAQGATGTGTPLVATIAGVTAGDVLICEVLDEYLHLSSMTISNGTTTTDTTSTERIGAHAIATSTASTTCTASYSAASTNSVMIFADYKSQ